MNVLDAIYFYVFAALAVAGAMAVVIAKNPIRGAMGLLLLILSVAALFLPLGAEFLAAIQLIVYAGAIVVLFLFVIMLLGPSAIAPHDRRGLNVRVLSGTLFAVASAAAVTVVARGGVKPTPLPVPQSGFGGIEAFGSALFSDAILPFELSSALLMVAVVGAIAVARGRQGLRSLSRGEQAIASSAPEAGTKDDRSGVFSHEIHLGETKGHSA